MIGLILSLVMIALDTLAKNVKVRLFNTTTLGLLFGFLMAQAILFITKGILGKEPSEDLMMPIRYIV